MLAATPMSIVSGDSGTRARSARTFCQWRTAAARSFTPTHSAARRLQRAAVGASPASSQ